MSDTKALAYVMARGPKVFAISISMKAGDGVALPVAAKAAVATVVPVIVCNDEANSQRGSSNGDSDFLYGTIKSGHPHAGTVQSPTKGIPLAHVSCVVHQVSGHNQAPAK